MRLCAKDIRSLVDLVRIKGVGNLVVPATRLSLVVLHVIIEFGNILRSHRLDAAILMRLRDEVVHGGLVHMTIVVLIVVGRVIVHHVGTLLVRVFLCSITQFVRLHLQPSG